MHHKTLSKLSIIFRSSLFSLFMITTIVIYSFICILASMLPLHYRHAIVRSWCKMNLAALKFLCHIDYQIQGLENIPSNQSVVVLSNHQSAWETFFLPTLFHGAAIILKRELLWIPFFGWGLASLSPIAINRRDTSSAMQQVLQQGKKYLAAGRSILVFPEGTRIPAGKIGKYRLGGARLAIAAEHPIIPVAHNAGRFWPKRTFIKKPGTICIAIGPSIKVKNRTPEEVTQEVKQWIETMMNEIDAINNIPFSPIVGEGGTRNARGG